VPAFPEAEYTFKHALTQEVAYNSVLSDRRKLLHERAGRAIESLHAGRLEDHFDELAHHYSRSDNVAKAVQYLRLASAQALSRSHYTAAIAHAQAALHLLDKLPDGPDRLRAEMALHLVTAQVSMVTIGYTAPEVGKALGRAEAICRQIGSTVDMFAVMLGLCGYYGARGEHRRAHELAVKLAEIGLNEESDALLVDAYLQLSVTLYWLGQFAQALANAERVIAHNQPGGKLPNVTGADSLVTALQIATWSLWHLGYADKALEMSARTLEHSGSQNHPYSIAVARAVRGAVRCMRRDNEAKEEAETLIAFSTEHGFPDMQAVGSGLRSQALMEQGSVAEPLAETLETIEYMRTKGIRVSFPVVLCRLAEAYGKRADPGNGLAAASEALTEIEATSERMCEAELHRVRGELLLIQNASDTAQAEQAFRTAIDVARRQQARFYELRATTRLAGLLDQQGKRDDARSMLAEIYGWFTEGFDTADLKDAKALLDELNH